MTRRKGIRKSQANKRTQARSKRNDEAKPLPRVGFHSLPIEILDTILKHAFKATLLASSRVSRMWRDFALPHLFASVKVAREWSYDDFFDFLNAHPKLMRYIRSLELASASPYAFDTHPTIDPSFLRMLAEKLPRLEKLSLERLTIASGSTPADTAEDMPGVPLAGRPNGAFRLKQLSIDRPNGYDCDLYILLVILCTLPTDSIRVVDAWLKMPDSFDRNHPSIRHLPPLDISSLSLENFYLSPSSWAPVLVPLEKDAVFCDALRQMLLPRRLQTLSLGVELEDRNKTRLDALGKLLRHAVKKGLRNYSLPFKIQCPIDPQEEDADFWRVLRLDHFPELETFGISLCLPSPVTQPVRGSTPRGIFSAVCIALMSHLPRTLHALELTLWGVKEQSQLKNAWVIDLGLLDDALQEYFPSLAKLRVVFKGDFYLLEFATFVLRAMPKSKARGILEVTDTRYSSYK
ncbi:hypothetical protein GY45DRAFT_1338947 [Cubamyces sp. BRFM 1775]|nr:hypothetical protein GY45DRAFT_1338947 [Cubamyces sp. BRFM 1775]